MRICYETPIGWDFPKLESLALKEKGSIRIGPFGSALKKHEYSDSGIGVLGIEHVHPNEFRWETPKYIPDTKYEELTQYTVAPGDVLVTNMGTVGRACFVPEGIETSIISSHLIKVSLNPEVCYSKYLCYVLNYSEMVKAQIVSKSHGAIMAGFNSSLLKELKIPLPPLPEQKRIAAILDAADAYRQKTKTLLTKYDELAQSLFLEMFGDPVTNPKGWEVKDFEDIAEFDTKMTKDWDSYGEYLHVGVGNIERDTGKIFGCKTANEEGLTSGKYLFSSEHIIYSKIRPNLNKVALPDFQGLCSADSYPIKPKITVTNRLFLAYLLRSESFLDFILKHSSRTNIPKANKNQMKLYKGIAPPITLQNQFAERVEAIEKQKAQAQQSLEKAEELFQSLLQRAFSGSDF